MYKDLDIGNERQILIIDNFSHIKRIIYPRIAFMVGRLTSCATSKWLITSRIERFSFDFSVAEIRMTASFIGKAFPLSTKIVLVEFSFQF